MKIWERYFLRETLKVLFLFLFCFYGLYVLIDFSSHSSSANYHHSTLGWWELFYYYLCEFIQRLDVLLPFALLLATVRTLCNLSLHNELVAMMASGVRMKTLLRPFLMVGLIATALLYLNTEFFVPAALRKVRLMKDSHAALKKKNQKTMRVKHVALKDESTLLFQTYDAAHDLFLDAYWVKSADDITHFKILHPNTKPPRGDYIERLKRNPQGQLILVESMEKGEFPEMRFNKKVLLETVTPVEEYSLRDLWKKFPHHEGTPSEKESLVMTAFYRKMALPWMCLLAVLGPAPFCVRFNRDLPVFFIYAFSIFGLVAFYLLLDASSVLGRRQVLPPFWSIWPPFIGGSALIFFRFLKRT